nr:hypothetical protein [Tanacetum cinerariifolium]
DQGEGSVWGRVVEVMESSGVWWRVAGDTGKRGCRFGGKIGCTVQGFKRG